MARTAKTDTTEEVKAPVVDKGGIEIEVSDPELYRPKELPLIVKPKGGKWANKAQEEYAKIVNAYAYANPDKWHNDRIDMNGNPIPKSSKKEILLKRLADLEKAPGLLVQFMGNVVEENKKLTFKNKLHED